jgi:hypothetical protein
MLFGIHFWMSKKPIYRATDSLHNAPFWGEGALYLGSDRQSGEGKTIW